MDVSVSPKVSKLRVGGLPAWTEIQNSRKVPPERKVNKIGAARQEGLQLPGKQRNISHPYLQAGMHCHSVPRALIGESTEQKQNIPSNIKPIASRV